MPHRANPLLFFNNNPAEVVNHMQAIAWAYVGSTDFEQMTPQERSNWLFRHCMLSRLLVSLLHPAGA